MKLKNLILFISLMPIPTFQRLKELYNDQIVRYLQAHESSDRKYFVPLDMGILNEPDIILLCYMSFDLSPKVLREIGKKGLIGCFGVVKSHPTGSVIFLLGPQTTYEVYSRTSPELLTISELNAVFLEYLNLSLRKYF